MEQNTDNLYPSAPLMRSDQDLEERLEKNDGNSFKNSINNIKEMIIYFKDKKHKSKKKYKKYKMITTILKSFDTFVIFAITLRSITLSLTWFGLIVIPKSTASTCALLIGNNVIYEIIMQKNYKFE